MKEFLRILKDSVLSVILTTIFFICAIVATPIVATILLIIAVCWMITVLYDLCVWLIKNKSKNN
jgi:hypothetical protein